MSITVDYQFYTGDYGGSLISSAKWSPYANRALFSVQSATMRREPKSENTDGTKRYKYAVCAVADALFQMDGAKTAANMTISGNDAEAGAKVKSKSSGQESISYSYTEGVSAEQIGVYRAIQSKMTERAYIYETICEYLSDTEAEDGRNILFRGA